MRLAKENRDNEVFLFSPCLYLLGKMQAVRCAVPEGSSAFLRTERILSCKTREDNVQ